MNFQTDDYLTNQIIAYIGNKRKLLQLIYNAISSVYKELPSGLKFLDLFSGSGVVSRLAKRLNFEIFSNDWEDYSYIINSAYIGINKNEIPELFKSENQFICLLHELNELPKPTLKEQYIAKYYAPSNLNIDKADFRTERLFYTKANALQIDKIRNRIDILYPPNSNNIDTQKKRNLLIALLLYQAATHTNTSGVFKAFHKGFGGHNKDALKRILSPINLAPPILIDSDYPSHIYKKDANELIKLNELQNIDIAYLDPPYNQHQYGSNYHMLNTVAIWDKIPAPLKLKENGRLKEKAAIRKDWIKTRSEYCYKATATESFQNLLSNLSAKHILISYSTDGIIPFTAMKEICTKKGRISIVTNEYTKYRGGKQSNQRLNTNIEFILIIDTTKRRSKMAVEKVDHVVKKKELLLLFRNTYSEKKLRMNFNVVKNNFLTAELDKNEISIETSDFFKLKVPSAIDSLSHTDINLLKEKLIQSQCMSKEEELEEIINKINGNPLRNEYFVKKIPDILKKLAHKKNKEIFFKYIEKISTLKQTYSDLYSTIHDKMESIKELAEKRFNN